MTSVRRPLEGVRVIELASFVSLPFAGMMLADLGADVIKVEPPRGEPFRRFGRPSGAMAPVFANVNGGKKSVVLDLKQPDDLAALHGLLRTADVMLSNWRPGVTDRLGLADATLAADNPRLVRIYVSGYGQTGPDSDKPAFDSVIQARGALTWIEGDDETPKLAPGYAVDKLTAVFATQSVLAALVGRASTGEGTAIDLAMIDVNAYFNFPEHFSNRTFVDAQPVEARFSQANANRAVRASDGWLVVAAVTADQIRATTAAMDHPEWGDELLAIKDAKALTAAFLNRVEQATATRTVADCLAAFETHDVPAVACASADDLIADRQVGHNQLFEIVDRPGLGRVREIRYPARSVDWGRLGHRSGAPLVDADRAEILRRE